VPGYEPFDVFCDECELARSYGSVREVFHHLKKDHGDAMAHFGTYTSEIGITPRHDHLPCPVYRLSALPKLFSCYEVSTILSECVGIITKQSHHLSRISYGLVDVNQEFALTSKMEEELLSSIAAQFTFLQGLDETLSHITRDIMNSTDNLLIDSRSWRPILERNWFKLGCKVNEHLVCAQERFVLLTNFPGLHNSPIATSLDPHSLLLWLMNGLITKPVIDDLTTSALYRKLFHTLKSKAYNNPRKRWIHTIHMFDEEVQALQEVTDWQRSCILDFQKVIHPQSRKLLAMNNRRSFNFRVFDQKFIEQRLLQNVKDDQEDYEALLGYCGPLIERTKMISEINEEDHGKVSLYKNYGSYLAYRFRQFSCLPPSQ
jgi:hypothetical protein